ncbi:hypothetical protein IHE70_22295 [Streptomyces sp. ID-01-6.2a]|uniref:Carrier domain-containing protein n=2 Tax=Streptomyces caniscabiei TaxID=2746961 RepID=A0A927L5F8_9ACTN|nr:hypothetical protein [Streptomyces caniscabiei]
MAKVLRDLREREIRLLDELASTLEAPPHLISLISSVLSRQTDVKTEHLQPTDDLWAAGLTSLESVRVMIGLEDELGIEFPTSLLARNTFGSIAAIAEAIGGLLAGTSNTAEGQVGR